MTDSMKFCRGGRPITPGAWQTHTDHACEVAGPAEVTQDREDAAVDRWEACQEAGAAAVRRCAYCGHLGDLEPIRPGPSPSVACVNIALCELRRLGLDPADHLTTVARAVAKDVTRLTEVELARVILTLKATVVAAETELGNNRDRARGDAALAQAAGELAPRSPDGRQPAMTHYMDQITSRWPASEETARRLLRRPGADLEVVVEDHDRGQLLTMPEAAARQYIRFHDAEIRT
jgi:hypothetical protein